LNDSGDHLVDKQKKIAAMVTKTNTIPVVTVVRATGPGDLSGLLTYFWTNSTGFFMAPAGVGGYTRAS
jgi:hypothetical protein